MKRSEIKVGHSYTSGNGRVRKVIAEGPEYKMYSGQMSSDNLRYEIVNDGTKKNSSAGTQHNMSARSFASWAKEEVV